MLIFRTPLKQRNQITNTQRIKDNQQKINMKKDKREKNKRQLIKKGKIKIGNKIQIKGINYENG